MFMEERQKDIVKKLNENGRVLVSELQERYGISADCARRDLRMLEGKGLLQRTHGGAIALSKGNCFPAETYSPEDFPEERPDYRSVAAEAVKTDSGRGGDLSDRFTSGLRYGKTSSGQSFRDCSDQLHFRGGGAAQETGGRSDFPGRRHESPRELP